MFGFSLKIAVLLLAFAALDSLVDGVPRDVKCTKKDPRQIYPHCMLSRKSKILWCDQSNYTKIPSLNEMMSQVHDYDCTTAEAIFVNDSCLESINREDLKPYREIRTLQCGQNYVSVLRHLTFYANQKLEEIDLSDNEIHTLEERSLAGLHSLRRLRLDNNGISQLRHQLFNDLHKLEELSMENNILESIDHRVLRRQHTLRRLNLKGNRIVRIDDFAFKKNAELRQLYLDGNAIETVTVNTFSGLDKLEILTISHNRIKSWPEEYGIIFTDVHTLSLSSNLLEEFTSSYLENMTSVQNLLLDNNSLSILQDDLFLSTPRMTFLNLSANNFQDIPERAFSSLCHLESLILTNNKLTTPKEGWFQNLAKSAMETTHTAISENQWSCDCNALRFMRFQEALTGRTENAARMLSKKLEIRCHTPNFAASLVLDKNLSAEIKYRLKCPQQVNPALRQNSLNETYNVCGHTKLFNREYYDVSSQYVPQQRRQIMRTVRTQQVVKSYDEEQNSQIGPIVGGIFIAVLLMIASSTLLCLILRRKSKDKRRRILIRPKYSAATNCG